jgi:hypothetical protein
VLHAELLLAAIGTCATSVHVQVVSDMAQIVSEKVESCRATNFREKSETRQTPHWPMKAAATIPRTGSAAKEISETSQRLFFSPRCMAASAGQVARVIERLVDAVLPNKARLFDHAERHCVDGGTDCRAGDCGRHLGGSDDPKVLRWENDRPCRYRADAGNDGLTTDQERSVPTSPRPYPERWRHASVCRRSVD